MRIDSQPAYLLHSRPYRDTSLIVELVTSGYGRVSAVVKGVRSQGKSAKLRRSLLQPFTPLSLGWSGNTDLKTVNRFEAAGAPVPLKGERLFSGIYVNELLTRLLHHYDEHPLWFELYEQVLYGLIGAEHTDVVLRRFEFDLLRELGYGVDLTAEGVSGAPVIADQRYYFDPQQGLSRCEFPSPQPAYNLFAGADLLALAAGDYSTSVRRSAKQLCRLALAAQLGEKPLKSRELFNRAGTE